MQDFWWRRMFPGSVLQSKNGTWRKWGKRKRKGEVVERLCPSVNRDVWNVHEPRLHVLRRQIIPGFWFPPVKHIQTTCYPFTWRCEDKLTALLGTQNREMGSRDAQGNFYKLQNPALFLLHFSTFPKNGIREIYKTKYFLNWIISMVCISQQTLVMGPLFKS